MELNKEGKKPYKSDVESIVSSDNFILTLSNNDTTCLFNAKDLPLLRKYKLKES
jgi:hypothetical protein